MYFKNRKQGMPRCDTCMKLDADSRKKKEILTPEEFFNKGKIVIQGQKPDMKNRQMQQRT